MNNELFLHRDTHSHTHTNNKLLAVTLKMDRMTKSLRVPLHTVRERARFGWSRVCLPEKVIQACVKLTAVNFIKFSFTCTHAMCCKNGQEMRGIVITQDSLCFLLHI